jgi:hypothetical protein
MKIKQSILFISAMMIFSFCFAQDRESNMAKFPVIIAESGIKSITATDNIDLLLINASSEEIRTLVPQECLDKVKITYSRGNLKISTKGFLPQDERVPVYVYVDDLQTLTLTGNAFARSRDILDLTNLKVNIEDEAKVALRSRGKMKVNAPENYRRIEEERYHLVLSTQ